jgi:4-amino-4-deoxy-L-arabinose transferase-like glycosyltransferase
MEASTRTRRAHVSTLVVTFGLLAIAIAVALVGLRSERHLQGANHVRAVAPIAPLAPGETACQRGEVVPAGTGGIRLRVAGDGARFTVTTGGARGTARVATSGPVDVDLPETTARRVTTVCVTNAGPGPLTLEGGPPASSPRGADGPAAALAAEPASLGGAPLGGRMRIDYLRPHAESWWAFVPVLAERIAGARDALPGDASAYLFVLLAVAAVAAGLARRRLRLKAGLAVALLAALNAVSWGMLVPPFAVPDEQSHLYYAQYLGETGKLPSWRPGAPEYAGDVRTALAGTAFAAVAGDRTARPSWDFEAPDELPRRGTGNAVTASSNPPLYYVAQAAVYRAAHAGDVLDRLAVMRLFSALLAGLTAWCVFAFLRELLPRSPLAWTVGGLLTGLMPMFAFITSGVNNDAGLYLAAAALFLALARILRRGITPRRAAACGAVLGAGVLIKTQLLAFAPAVALAFVLARAPWRAWAAGASAATLPLALYGALGATVWSRPVLDRVGVLGGDSGRSGTLTNQLSYAWQEYLPRLPGMADLVPGIQPYSLWFKGLVGRFGWLDYGFPEWAYLIALVIVGATTVAAGRCLWRERRERARELAVLGLAALGLMGAVATVSYHAVPPFDQGRYLLPLLPLFALIPALAVRTAGRTAGALLLVAALGFSVFAQLVTIARYYG